MSDSLQTRFRVTGMDCASCANKIDTAVRRIPGIQEVSISVTAGTMTVEHTEISALDTIRHKLSGLGYQASLISTISKTVVKPVHKHGQDCTHDHLHGEPHGQSSHDDHSDHGAHCTGHDHEPDRVAPSDDVAPPILQARFRIGGMDCASCAAKIDTAIRRIDAVEDVAVSVTAGTMTVKHRQSADMKAIEKRVSGLGYTIVPIPGTDRHS